MECHQDEEAANAGHVVSAGPRVEDVKTVGRQKSALWTAGSTHKKKSRGVKRKTCSYIDYDRDVQDSNIEQMAAELSWPGSSQCLVKDSEAVHSKAVGRKSVAYDDIAPRFNLQTFNGNQHPSQQCYLNGHQHFGELPNRHLLSAAAAIPQNMLDYVDPTVSASEKQAIFKKAPSENGTVPNKKQTPLTDSQKRKLEKKKFYREKQLQQEEAQRVRAANMAKKPKKPCRFYLAGRCSKGADCTFSHDCELTKRPELCKYYLRGACTKGAECIYYHGQWPCIFFHKFKFCMNGDTCKFSHLPLTDETRPLLEKSDKTSQNTSLVGAVNGVCKTDNKDDDRNADGCMQTSLPVSARSQQVVTAIPGPMLTSSQVMNSSFPVFPPDPYQRFPNIGCRPLDCRSLQDSNYCLQLIEFTDRMVSCRARVSLNPADPRTQQFSRSDFVPKPCTVIIPWSECDDVQMESVWCGLAPECVSKVPGVEATFSKGLFRVEAELMTYQQNFPVLTGKNVKDVAHAKSDFIEAFARSVGQNGVTGVHDAPNNKCNKTSGVSISITESAALVKTEPLSDKCSNKSSSSVAVGSYDMLVPKPQVTRQIPNLDSCAYFAETKPLVNGIVKAADIETSDVSVKTDPECKADRLKTSAACTTNCADIVGNKQLTMGSAADVKVDLTVIGKPCLSTGVAQGVSINSSGDQLLLSSGCVQSSAPIQQYVKNAPNEPASAGSEYLKNKNDLLATTDDLDDNGPEKHSDNIKPVCTKLVCNSSKSSKPASLLVSGARHLMRHDVSWMTSNRSNVRQKSCISNSSITEK